MLHIGELVAVVGDGNVGWASTTDPCSADFAMANRVEQNPKSTEVVRMQWPNAADRHAVFELALVVRGGDNGRVDRQDIEPRTILAAVVAQLDNISLAK